MKIITLHLEKSDILCMMKGISPSQSCDYSSFEEHGNWKHDGSWEWDELSLNELTIELLYGLYCSCKKGLE